MNAPRHCFRTIGQVEYWARKLLLSFHSGQSRRRVRSRLTRRAAYFFRTHGTPDRAHAKSLARNVIARIEGRVIAQVAAQNVSAAA